MKKKNKQKKFKGLKYVFASKEESEKLLGDLSKARALTDDEEFEMLFKKKDKKK